MGCICSKGAADEDVHINENERYKGNQFDISSVQLVAPEPSKKEEDIGGKVVLVHTSSKSSTVIVQLENGEKNGKNADGSLKNRHHQRRATMDLGSTGNSQHFVSRITSMPHGSEKELIEAGWPQWLTTAAPDAIKGWLPRRADSFERLDKIGQGTYSSVYKARDLETGKIVAMKKVRFVNMDPESVRFMAREIHILRKLDHPNIMKLESIVTSRMSDSLYLVFEYMEHDLAGIAATPGMKFTEPQIKCYMQQLLRGLEHCHSRGVLHRDIKGSNLLIDNNGILKIGDFGLATFYQPDQSQALTSRVVTLWYRAPELLLGATQYGDAIDLWSTGCILAELFAGKPIMPGRTEVEQMHKILKLCGSAPDDYWKKTKLPQATSFRPQHNYKRRISETFKNFPPSALSLVDKLLTVEPEDRGSATSALNSEFFCAEPFPCDPSTLPKYPPSKELDAKVRDEEARRKRAEAVKGRGTESVRGTFSKLSPEEFIPPGQTKTTCTSYKYDMQEDAGSGFRIEPAGGYKKNGLTQTNSMIHPSSLGAPSNKSSKPNPEIRSRDSQPAEDVPNTNKKDERFSGAPMGNVRRKNRIHYSGPLMPPGGNMEEMLKEHERQIQQAVRKARLEKSATKKNIDD
ncbi:probable serine/threonine-protein kinase At1g09600 [Euphorbia lathyris]|uniref:probable serine/threonine-protein kinase At1g09600 n=1 Tax=Euphorbia lathyris TaxID=212925 RepID=UPI00331435C1